MTTVQSTIIQPAVMVCCCCYYYCNCCCYEQLLINIMITTILIIILPLLLFIIMITSIIIKVIIIIVIMITIIIIMFYYLLLLLFVVVVGHFEDSRLLDAVSGDRYATYGPTNAEVLSGTDPRSEAYNMPYIYAHLSWSHCQEYKKGRYDIDALLQGLAAERRNKK